MMQRFATAWLALVILASWSYTGCLNRKLAPAEPDVQTAVVETIGAGETKADILFIIDNSGSMREEQQELRERISVMARELISPTPRGEATPPPVEDLHLGIVSTDLGVCPSEDEPDDGLLQNTSDSGPPCSETYSAANCAGESCPWFVHSPEFPGDQGTPIWEQFGCVAELGTRGCGYEMPLEASRRALDPQGHGAAGGPNAGFLRSDSLLVLIYVTDEDDCSPVPESTFFSGLVADDEGRRFCIREEEQLVPVQDYYNFFVGLRGGNPDRVVAAAIVGLPDEDETPWQLGDPIENLRQIREDKLNEDNWHVNSICESGLSGMGGELDGADPPVRIAEFIQQFGTNAYMGSICDGDWTNALSAITRKIQANLEGVCVSRPLASTSPDVCRVIETRVDDGPCPNVIPEGTEPEDRGPNQWRRDLGVVDVAASSVVTSRRECEILAADYDADGCPDGAANCAGGDYSGGKTGWFYESNNAECEHGQVRFTSDNISDSGSALRFECLTGLCSQHRLVAPRFAEADCPAGACATCTEPRTVSGCPDGQVAVRHSNGAMCGYQRVSTSEGSELRACSCEICTPVVGQRCPAIAEEDAYRASLALVESGGCCAVGFHWDDAAGECAPDRNTDCR
jgi:hypothetical protein